MNVLNKPCKQKVENRKSEHHRKFEIFEIIYAQIFSFNKQFGFFWNKFAQKMCLQYGKEKNENHHQILHVQISLGTNFQLQQTILIFWNKFTKKER